MNRRKRKSKSKLGMVLVALAIAMIVTYVYRSQMFTKDDDLILKKESDHSFGSSNSIVSDNLQSPYAILIRLNDHDVIMQKNASEKIFPASLTKIMTALVAIEHLPDLQDKVILHQSMFSKLYQEDASMAGFGPNEVVRAKDLLYGLLLPSGAECSIGLADYVAGSENNFVKLMNQKANELGMNHTHFTNATGLQDENHYSTVKDLGILLCYALKNNTFKEIFTSSFHTTQPTNLHPNGVAFDSTMFKALKNPNIPGGKILGGKTGYTDEAGLCLASLAEENGKEYVLVTAGAKGNHHTEQYDITDAVEVYKSLTKSE